jgi:gas vesicle protein
MRKFFGFLAGVICGALVGVVAGLLLAPYAGPELQRRIRGQVEGLVEKGQKAAASKRTELEMQLEAFKKGQAVVLQESSGSTD